MSLTVAVTGQILIHGPLDISGEGQRQVMDFLAADVAFANLEATVTTEGAWPTKTKTLHLASPEALVSVRKLGFHALTHANNHAFDLGPPGIASTRAAAERAGLKLTGSGMSIEEAARPAVLGNMNNTLAIFSVDLGPQPDITYASSDRAGTAPLRMKRTVSVPPDEFAMLQRLTGALGDDKRSIARTAVGYDIAEETTLQVFGTPVVPGDAIGVSFLADERDWGRLMAGIGAAKAAGHLVAIAVHTHHWDANWSETPEWMLDLCRDLIDDGADIILGTGSPVMQPIFFHRGKAIIPGLGNFVFHTNRASTYDEKGVDVWRSAALRLTLGYDGVCTGLDILPVAVGRPSAGISPAPVPLTENDAEAVRVRALSRTHSDTQ
ncbi:poly-gamma-glutamate synthesis protein (capsule biosynthesis protein) [Rhizobium sp. BK529]|uniref:CapA family protein n=1 Tax=unclassified Rhizobium TaxID=2613769 RepID=UPI00104B3616|nr:MULTISPECIES: CapA family protein [unclassified Rhizobium]MBB3593840.1 poly-gamma-glutamate synthesis protein (capsule biosynthesis protein) [Rhizobium sp. BK529]TCS01297.1 poly-gamma-glutamate synthesis protein (capsule biosynthesis protein) [Rhizobium sp. BK418]